jgi:hypothetical protein
MVFLLLTPAYAAGKPVCCGAAYGNAGFRVNREWITRGRSDHLARMPAKWNRFGEFAPNLYFGEILVAKVFNFGGFALARIAAQQAGLGG